MAQHEPAVVPTATDLKGQVRGPVAQEARFIQLVKPWPDKTQAAYDEVEHKAEQHVRSIRNPDSSDSPEVTIKNIKKLLRKHKIHWAVASKNKVKAAAWLETGAGNSG